MSRAKPTRLTLLRQTEHVPTLERPALRAVDIERITGLKHTSVNRLLNTPVSAGGIPCRRVYPTGKEPGVLLVDASDFEAWWQELGGNA